MNLKKLLTLSSFVSIAFFIGCGGNQPQVNKNIEISVPWVDFCNNEVNKIRMNGGIAACKCEETDDITDNFSMTIAENKAREELGKILDTKVTSLVEGHQDKTRYQNKSVRGSHYEDTLKQLVKQNLQGSYPIAHKIFRTEKNTYEMCAVVALDPNRVKNLIAKVAKKTGIEDDKLLYEEFKSYKAQQKLNNELNKN